MIEIVAEESDIEFNCPSEQSKETEKKSVKNKRNTKKLELKSNPRLTKN